MNERHDPQAADSIALFDLVARYAVAVDQRDERTLATLFAPDATMLIPPTLGGSGVVEPVGAAGRLIRALERFERTRHTVAQQVVDVRDDRATGITYAEAHHLYTKADQLHDFAVALRYLDAYIRIAGRWQISHRELAVDWVQRRTLTDPGRSR